MIRCMIVVLLCVLGSHIQAAESKLTVGFADADVTPDMKKPVYIAGFGMGRQAVGVHDPIMCRCVVLDDGESKIAICSIDLVGLFLPEVERIRKQLSDFDYVLVSCTHNHEGPDTIGLWGGSPFQSGVDPDYLDMLVKQAVDTIIKADSSRVAVHGKIGLASDGNLLSDSRKPIVKHDELVALQFLDANEKPAGIVVQWNCHPETLGSSKLLSGDFVPATVKHLQTKYNCPVVYLTGTVGGLLSALSVEVRDSDGNLLARNSFEKTERYGELVGMLADKALSQATDIPLTPFAIHRRTILIPVENGLYRIAKQFGILRRKMYLWNGRSDEKRPTEATDASKSVAVQTEVGYLQLGKLEIACIPGEIYSELVLDKVENPAQPGADYSDAAIEPAIYPLMGKHKMIIGLANDELGYFIPKRQWDALPPYCYDRKESQYGEINSVGPEASMIICKTFRDLVSESK